MRLRRGLVLGLVAGALATAGAFAAHEIAMARQKPVVLVRILTGYFDRRGKFVATAGRGATNVDRNALLMFVFSGAIDMGPKIQATLPLTLAEQAELDSLATKVRAGTATPAEQRRFRELGGDPDAIFEPGTIARRRNADKSARLVATGSVSEDSIRIVSTTGGNQARAEGVFFRVKRVRRRGLSARKLVFNPRYTVATFSNPGEIDYNAEGFDSLTEYSVSMNGGGTADNPLTTVQNLDGVPLGEPFLTTFTTSDRYIQDFTRPELRTHVPGDGSVNVPSDGDVELTFSEPMDIRTFAPPRFPGDPTATITMQYTNDATNGSLAGRDVLLQVRVKPQTSGNVVQLRPLQGFGKGPYDVTVTVTNGVTDLSGNNIIREQQFTFQTDFDPQAEEFDEISEPFDTNDQEDTNFGTPADPVSGDNLLADWNKDPLVGFLSTSVQDVTFDVLGPSRMGNVNIWFPRAVRWQVLYQPTDMGGRPRTLTSFSWYQAGAQSNLTYPNTQVRMGHATDLIGGGGFIGGTSAPGPIASNYRETPVIVSTSQNYTIPTGIPD